MRRNLVAAICVGLIVAGCDSGEPDLDASTQYALAEMPESEFGFSEAMAPSPMLLDSADMAVVDAAASAQANAMQGSDEAGADEPADGAQIAYSYSYGFRVDADEIDDLQQRHAALCEKMGPNRCRVLNLSRAASDDQGYGALRLRVAATEARAFGSALDKAADGLDAERVSFGIDGEDLTETIIDTEAHLAGRRLLRERLMGVLRTQQGSVADLVAAERAVAEVNEEIDSAASRLSEMRNRVRMSAVSIEYAPDLAAGSGGFVRPIGRAVSSVGTTLGVTIAGIIYVAVALIPITAFLLLLRWLWRRSGFRIRREKKIAE